MTTIRRQMLSVIAAAAVSLVLQPALSGQAAAQDATAEQGGTLTWAFLRRPQSLDPNIWSGGSDLAVMRQMYDTLIWSPEPGKFEPGLATEWSVSDDGPTYTFKLRDDVTFHDGTPFNAEAVKFMFERIKNPESKSLNIGAVGPFESATVIDEHTVEIKLTSEWGAFLTNVSEPHLSPVSPTAVEEMGDGVAQAPVGTARSCSRNGKATTSTWCATRITLGPGVHGHDGPAYLDKLIVKEVPEASTRINALRSGEVDMIHFPVMSDVESLESTGYQVFRMDQPGFSWSFPINIAKAPTDDLKVRQAMLHAINKDQIVRTVMFDQVSPAYGPLTAVTFGYDPSIESLSGYDLEKAGALLDEAGWTLEPGATVRTKDGQPLEIKMAMFESSVNKSVSEFAQAMLQQAGFDVTLDVQNYPAFATQIANGDYNTAQMRWSAVDPDQVIPTMFGSNQVTGGGQFNRTRIADPALDALIAKAGASGDNAERTEPYAQIQKQAMENVWLIPIYDDVWFFLTKPEVQNFKADLQGRPILYVASIKG